MLTSETNIIKSIYRASSTNFYQRKSSVHSLFQNYEMARKLPKDKEIKGTKTLS